jgi:hypothetical protein
VLNRWPEPPGIDTGTLKFEDQTLSAARPRVGHAWSTTAIGLHAGRGGIG